MASNPEPQDPDADGFRRRRLFLFAAAAVVIMISALGIYTLIPPKVEFPESEFNSAETFRDHMALFASSPFSLDKRTSELSTAGSWLEERHYPTYTEIPARIVRFGGIGCKSIDWGGNKVGLVCFVNDSRQLVYLFVIERSALLDLDSSQTRFASVAIHRDLETGGWLDEKFAYLLVGSEPEVKIGSILAAN